MRKQSGKDLDFIAHARTDIPHLVHALEEVERELGALDRVFGKDDDVVHAVITQVRSAISEALAAA